jgi:hypothetical protein
MGTKEKHALKVSHKTMRIIQSKAPEIILQSTGPDYIKTTVFQPLCPSLNLISSLSEPVGHVQDHLLCIFYIHDSSYNESCDPVGAYTAPEVVTCRNGRESPGIIIESHRIMESRRFHHSVKIVPHAIDTIVEPPRRPELNSWVMAGKGSQFT